MSDSLIARMERVQVEHWVYIDPHGGDLLCAGCDLRTDSPERAATHTIPQLLAEFQVELDRLREEWQSSSLARLQEAEGHGGGAGVQFRLASRVDPIRVSDDDKVGDGSMSTTRDRIITEGDQS